MQSVGQKLRLSREALDYTIEQVNLATRIPVKILEAIEADDLSTISSAFHYRSFVRQFAEHLGLDYSALQPSVQTTAERMPALLIPGEGPNAAPKIGALHLGKRRNSRWGYSLSLFAVALVACSGVYAFWQNFKVGLPIARQKIAVVKNSPVPSTPAAGTPTPLRTSSSALPRLSQFSRLSQSSGEVRSDPRDSNHGGFTLELSATEPAWLSIVADGKISFKGILERAETKILEGHQTARIRTGNAGAVEVVFNGKSLGALGSKGQVRTVLFTKNDYEIIHVPTRISFVKFNQGAELALFSQPLQLLPDL